MGSKPHSVSYVPSKPEGKGYIRAIIFGAIAGAVLALAI